MLKEVTDLLASMILYKNASSTLNEAAALLVSLRREGCCNRVCASPHVEQLKKKKRLVL